MIKPLRVCITYDDNFEPMCAHLCANLRVDGIQIRLNKTESEDDFHLGFQSKNWYMNLSEKIKFLRKNMDQIDYGEIICVSDADIQFFKPKDLLRIRSIMESSDIEYMGQREGETNFFNGGFFLIKKNEKTLSMITKIISEDLKKYKHAEQDLINDLILKMDVFAVKLPKVQYFSGCLMYLMDAKFKDKIVMHHATCAFNLKEKMEQMNRFRSIAGFNKINWRLFQNSSHNQICSY